MTDRQMDNRVKKLKELEEQYKALEDSIDSLKNELKAALAENHEDEHNTGSYIIKNKVVISNRLDNKALKADLPDVYTKYSKESSSTRFTVSNVKKAS